MKDLKKTDILNGKEILQVDTSLRPPNAFKNIITPWNALRKRREQTKTFATQQRIVSAETTIASQSETTSQRWRDYNFHEESDEQPISNRSL
jgi:hypothetical protein